MKKIFIHNLKYAFILVCNFILFVLILRLFVMYDIGILHMVFSRTMFFLREHIPDRADLFISIGRLIPLWLELSYTIIACIIRAIFVFSIAKRLQIIDFLDKRNKLISFSILFAMEVLIQLHTPWYDYYEEKQYGWDANPFYTLMGSGFFFVYFWYRVVDFLSKKKTKYFGWMKKLYPKKIEQIPIFPIACIVTIFSPYIIRYFYLNIDYPKEGYSGHYFTSIILVGIIIIYTLIELIKRIRNIVCDMQK